MAELARIPLLYQPGEAWLYDTCSTRFTSYYRAGPDGGLELGEGPVAILLTQVAADSPIPPEWMRNFWRYAATASA